MERLPSVPRTPLVKRHVVHEYVSTPSTVFFLNTSQRLCPAPDRNTNLKAYFNGTDTNYPGCLVLVIFIRLRCTIDVHDLSYVLCATSCFLRTSYIYMYTVHTKIGTATLKFLKSFCQCNAIPVFVL